MDNMPGSPGNNLEMANQPTANQPTGWETVAAMAGTQAALGAEATMPVAEAQSVSGVETIASVPPAAEEQVQQTSQAEIQVPQMPQMTEGVALEQAPGITEPQPVTEMQVTAEPQVMPEMPGVAEPQVAAVNVSANAAPVTAEMPGLAAEAQNTPAEASAMVPETSTAVAAAETPAAATEAPLNAEMALGDDLNKYLDQVLAGASEAAETTDGTETTDATEATSATETVDSAVTEATNPATTEMANVVAAVEMPSTETQSAPAEVSAMVPETSTAVAAAETPATATEAPVEPKIEVPTDVTTETKAETVATPDELGRKIMAVIQEGIDGKLKDLKANQKETPQDPELLNNLIVGNEMFNRVEFRLKGQPRESVKDALKKVAEEEKFLASKNGTPAQQDEAERAEAWADQFNAAYERAKETENGAIPETAPAAE